MPRSFAVNPIGVEFDPDAWLAELRSGTPAADLLARKVDLPVSPVGPDGTLRVMASSSEAMRPWNCSSCSRRKARAWTVTPAPKRSSAKTSPPSRLAGRASRLRRSPPVSAQ